uniref:Uncharacterized protein n=1 Tax=Ditylenchus dipsaci TaxID=166011 RepID=A0A915CUU3_9BILA
MNSPGGASPAPKPNPPRNKTTSATTVQSTVNNKSTPPFMRGNSAGGNLGQVSNQKTASPKPTVSSRRRLSEMRNVGGVGANSSLDRCASMPKPNGAWRPVKKTAEEIVLDKLEVNWSVTTIREVFQQNKDTKPAKIDTLFGVEQNFTKQRAVATATIAGKGKPFMT